MLQQIKNTIRFLAATVAVVGVVAVPGLMVTTATYAQGNSENNAGQNASDSVDDVQTRDPKKCTKEQIEAEKDKEEKICGIATDCTRQHAQLNSNNCGIIKIIVVVTNILSAIAATVIIMMIIIGGIQYSAAGANPQKVAAAKGKIINALIALMMFLFTFAFLQWLIPGGVFN